MYDTIWAPFPIGIGPKKAKVTTAVCRLYMSGDVPSSHYPGMYGRITCHNYAVNYGNTGIVFGQSGADRYGRGVRHPASRRRGIPGTQFTESGWSDVPAQVFKFSDITDGLSNTLMLAEVVQEQGDDPPDLRGFTWWGEALRVHDLCSAQFVSAGRLAQRVLQPQSESALRLAIFGYPAGDDGSTEPAFRRRQYREV